MLLFFIFNISFTPTLSENDSLLYQLLKTNRTEFIKVMTEVEQNDYKKAAKILRFISENFDWTATDYQKRTVDEIILRKGGNCNELALLIKSILKEADIPTRSIREINLHFPDSARQFRAEEKVRQIGKQLSVFGYQHNDHVWLEIYDNESNCYQPLDPSLGILGINEWMKARMQYSDRNLIDPNAQRMIVPLAIWLCDSKGQPIEDRSAYYLIESFDTFYKKQLSKNKTWAEWENSIRSFSLKAKHAFLATENLHKYLSEIEKLKDIYYKLKH